MTPQKSHLRRGIAEGLDRLEPERSRVGMRAVVVTLRDACSIRGALMRHHRVVPG
jgi:hypothetical protein